jgi:Predicted molecular chaperone distantly related to HSP70-fold metalloproteases
MLNIGGIANFTFLPGNLNADDVFSTDTGPGNTLMDGYIKKISRENILIKMANSQPRAM